MKFIGFGISFLASALSSRRKSNILYSTTKVNLLTVLLLVTVSICSSAQNLIKPTFFGLHANSGQWPTVSWGAYRSWDAGVRWMLLNPSYGSYSWTTLDYEMDASYANHARDFMFTFGVVPAWASTNPNGTGCSWANGSCYMPIMSYYTTFVQAIAQHSAARKVLGKPGITIYELWNEPDASNFWQGTTSQMVELAKAAYSLIHQYDPTAKVATPAPQGTYGWHWLQGYFAAGGAPYADMVDFHGYVGSQMPEAGLANLATIKQLAVQYGLSSKPLQDTEAYWWTITDPTAQTAWLARHYLLEASQGLSEVYWYSWNYGAKIQGTSNATVYAQLYAWLVGRSIAPCMQSGTVWTCNLTGASGWTGTAVWNTAGSSTFSVPSQFTSWQDLLGGTHAMSGTSVAINTIPILLTGSMTNQPPTAVLSVSPTSGTVPLAVTANGTASHDSNGSPVVRSTINFGDGTTVSGPTASHTFNSTGTFTVTLTVWDQNNMSDTAITTVVVNSLGNQLPVAELTVSPTSGTDPVTVSASTSLSSDPDGTIVSSVIDFGDGTVMNGANAAHTYRKSGHFTVTATIRDSYGAIATAAATVSVNRGKASH